MLSQNKGVTLITLAVTIILLIILTGVSVTVGYGTYKDMLLTSYVAKMNMVQARVNIVSQMVEQGDTSYDTVGVEISSLTTAKQDKVNTILEGASSDGFKYYDQTALELLGVGKIDEDVIINLNTRDIYSIVGIKYEDVMYYNQYDLPNGVQKIDYSELQTIAPEFTIEKDNYGLTTTVNITNIVYDEQINGSDIYYGEVIDATTTPVTVKFWQQANGTSFSVTKTATYAVKLIDRNGIETIKTVDVVTCNAPELVEGMVPVIYENGNWKKVDDSEIGKWYDYAEKKWANIMLSDGLVIEDDGTISTMGSMFVWIPRYAYQISSNYHGGGSNVSGNINLKFMKNLTYVTTDETTTVLANASGAGNWNVHPAFTDGSENEYANSGWDRELTGFWVAKFEASTSSSSGGSDETASDVKVISGVSSWNNISLKNAFINCLEMSNTDNIYGISSNAMTHLMKNSEWGAILYLAQSGYGRNGTEITSNKTNTTGYIHTSEEGMLTSTTGNVYGIYDINGCLYEFVAAGLDDYIDANLITITDFEEKTVDRYEKSSEGTDATANYNLTSTRFGDALYETSVNVSSTQSAWTAGGTVFITTGEPTLVRGIGQWGFKATAIGNDSSIRFPSNNSN